MPELGKILCTVQDNQASVSLYRAVPIRAKLLGQHRAENRKQHDHAAGNQNHFCHRRAFARIFQAEGGERKRIIRNFRAGANAVNVHWYVSLGCFAEAGVLW